MKKNKLLILIAVVSVFIACEKSVTPQYEGNIKVLAQEFPKDGIVRLLEKLNNPYTVENMKLAFASLVEEKAISTDISITPTHYYVKFTPMDSTECETLYKDSTIGDIFPYPLDYNITEGENFIDESCSTEFGCFYTKVPIDYISSIPNIKVLDTLFMPMEKKGINFEGTISEKDWLRLLNRASVITGNMTKDEEKIANSNQPTSPFLSAKISVWDDTKRYFVPSRGTPVFIRYFCSWRSTTTDSDGKCSMKWLPNRGKWSIKWEGEHWNIRQGSYKQAIYSGPNIKEKREWELNINKLEMNYMYAHINWACWRYWYNILGLKQPFKDNFWTKKIKIGAYDEVGRSNMNIAERRRFRSMVKIYRRERSNDGSIVEPNCANIIWTTSHELAHVSHWDMIGTTNFRKVDDIIVESWAMAVAYSLTVQLYSWNEFDHNNMQGVTFDKIKKHYENKYTPLAIDLMDELNQRQRNNNSTDYPVDNVSGYTLYEIEQSLKGVKNLGDWQYNLYHNYNNPTKQYLDELFNNYRNLQ